MMTEDGHLKEQLSKGHELQRGQAVSDLEAVLRLPQGRRFLLSMFERCGVSRNAYAGSENEATAFRLGEQNVGHWLIFQLEQVGATEYPRLLLEAAQAKFDRPEDVTVVDEEE